MRFKGIEQHMKWARFPIVELYRNYKSVEGLEAIHKGFQVYFLIVIIGYELGTVK